MRFQPRLIPLVIAAATILLGLKVSDLLSSQFTGDAEARAPQATDKATPTLPNLQASGAPVDLNAVANSLAKVSPTAEAPAAAPAPAASTAHGKEAAAKSEGSAKEGAAKAEAGEAAKPSYPVKDPSLLSPAEIEVLQQLAERRATLDQRASALDQQQIVLQAAEKRIDEKIAELQKLQKSIEADVAKQNQQDDARTQSLVKIYETMKPQEAAPILAQLDMPIALGVLTKMKERSTAAVLAAMDPARAQAITAALAQHRDPTAPGAVPAGKP